MQFGPAQLEAIILLAACTAAGLTAIAQSVPAAQPNSHIYRSADGQFTVEPPAGWQVRPEEGSNEVTFLNGNVSVSVATADTEAGDTVVKWLDVNKDQLVQQCPTAEVRGRGKTTVAGAPGEFLTMYCGGPKLPTTVRMEASIYSGRFYIFNITCPTAKLAEVQPLIEQMGKSFRANAPPAAKQ